MGHYSVIDDQVAWRVVDGEAVVIHHDTSAYYGLNRTGTFIWELLTDRARVLDDIVDRVAEKYDMPRQQVAEDVRAVLDRLQEESLLAGPGSDPSVSESEPESDSRTVHPPSTDYEPPQLTRFGELEQLLLSAE